MAVADDLADDLARDVLIAQDEMGNDRFYLEVAKVQFTLSPSMEEGFLTAIRVRLAERRGREFLDKRLAAHRQG
ncbi:MAG: hypothetical protein FJX28_09760 [Alphaproteobacteria bacterium]|nr:hypothetical protein [Alphaproteobacteria bacterium]